MNISRKKFVILFVVCGFAFLFITTSLLGTTGPRGFPKYPDSLLRTGSGSPIDWKRAVSTIILPIKIVLIGPLALSQINFLKEDPSPPFIGIYFIFYWTIFASIIHYLFDKLKRFKSYIKRIIFFIYLWSVLYSFLVNYYTDLFPFNDPVRITNGDLKQTVYALDKMKQNEVLHKVVSFFDNKIGSQNFSYNISAYNGFKLAFEATDPPLSYAESVMGVGLYGEVKEIPYNADDILWRGLQKNQIFSVIESVRFKPQNSKDIKNILLGSGATLIVSTVGRGWIKQEIDKSSKIILFILSPFILIWLIGTLQILIKFFKKGLDLRQ